MAAHFLWLRIHRIGRGLVSLCAEGFPAHGPFPGCLTSSSCAVSGSPHSTLATKWSSRDGSWHLEPTIKGPFGSWRFIDPNVEKQDAGGQLPLYVLFDCMEFSHVDDELRETRCVCQRRLVALMLDTSLIETPDWLIALYEAHASCGIQFYTSSERCQVETWMCGLSPKHWLMERRGKEEGRHYHVTSVEEKTR